MARRHPAVIVAINLTIAAVLVVVATLVILILDG